MSSDRFCGDRERGGAPWTRYLDPLHAAGTIAHMTGPRHGWAHLARDRSAVHAPSVARDPEGSPAMLSLVSRRFPGSVYDHGSEPDPRFSLANERTFLAWIRTALGLLAAGVAIEALDIPVHPTLRVAAAGLFVLLGLFCTTQAWIGWVRAERSLRESRPLPGPIGLPVVIGVVVAVLLLVVGWFL